MAYINAAFKNKLEYYSFMEEEIIKTYREAEANEDQEGMDAAKSLMDTHKEVMTGVESGDFIALYRDYRQAQKLGNPYLNLSDVLYPNNAQGYVDLMREQGVEFFTFSSTWSGALEVAWSFEEAGCTCIGMTEITTQFYEGMTDKHAKGPALLFKIQGVND